jgi:hypothetical protein
MELKNQIESELNSALRNSYFRWKAVLPVMRRSDDGGISLSQACSAILDR